jgi:uncharacterized protein YndB with AHSA1/START domain
MENKLSRTDREIISTRILNAPRELVFEVWTNPKHIEKWWGPDGFTNTISEMDVRVGGVWRFIMHGPDGTDYPNKIVYKEVIKPERLVFYHSSDDENETIKFDVIVNFIDVGEKTELIMRMTFRKKEDLDEVIEKYGALEGNKQTMDKLEAYLKTL